MVALPCCHVTLSGVRPKDCAYPAKLNTLGDHLRTRRLDLGLLQKEVAGQIGVTKCTIQYWETNRVSPAIRFIPLINEFLGYDLEAGISGGLGSMADRLKAHRVRVGLSRKKLAGLLRIDESSIAGWERGEHSPNKESLRVINRFLSREKIPRT
jgi:transcriptional regulator with XRE-family HTH domain